MVLEPGDPMWADVLAQHGFQYYAGKKSFIDESTGLTLSGGQLNMVYDWQRIFSFNSEGNPPDADRLSEEIEWALNDDTHLTMAQRHAME